MITKAQKKKIKKALGSNYGAAISAELKEMGVTNRNGQEHSSNMIRQVMNGIQHEDIERAIFSAVKKKSIEIKNRKELLKQI